MEFVQRQLRVRFRREWRDADGLGYRVTWRRKFAGIKVKPAYYAAVRTFRLTDGFKSWDFAQHRRPYKSMKAAVDACKRHKWIWDKFVELSHASGSGNRIKRLEDLNARGRVGGGHILGAVPIWVRGKAHKSLIQMLAPKVEISCEMFESDQSDLTPASTPSDEPNASGDQQPSETTQPSGPASNATVAAGSTSRKTVARSKATSSQTDTPAPTATEPVAAPVKPSVKRTRKSSKSGVQPSTGSSPKKGTAKRASPSSRKKNAKR